MDVIEYVKHATKNKVLAISDRVADIVNDFLRRAEKRGPKVISKTLMDSLLKMDRGLFGLTFIKSLDKLMEIAHIQHYTQLMDKITDMIIKTDLFLGDTDETKMKMADLAMKHRNIKLLEYLEKFFPKPDFDRAKDISKDQSTWLHEQINKLHYSTRIFEFLRRSQSRWTPNTPSPSPSPGSSSRRSYRSIPLGSISLDSSSSKSSKSKSSKRKSSKRKSLKKKKSA